MEEKERMKNLIHEILRLYFSSKRVALSSAKYEKLVNDILSLIDEQDPVEATSFDELK